MGTSPNKGKGVLDKHRTKSAARNNRHVEPTATVTPLKDNPKWPSGCHVTGTRLKARKMRATASRW